MSKRGMPFDHQTGDTGSRGRRCKRSTAAQQAMADKFEADNPAEQAMKTTTSLTSKDLALQDADAAPSQGGRSRAGSPTGARARRRTRRCRYGILKTRKTSCRQRERVRAMNERLKSNGVADTRGDSFVEMHAAGVEHVDADEVCALCKLTTSRLANTLVQVACYDKCVSWDECLR